MSYQFNINPNKLPDEKILRHKDFGKLMQNYQKMTHPLYRTPLYRFRKVLLIVVLTLLVAWLVAEFGMEQGKKSDSKDSVNKPVIHRDVKEKVKQHP
jgi:hypothetical protein